jgi:hypothetical protein
MVVKATLDTLLLILSLLIVGTLKDGYVRNVPLPRAAQRIQSAGHITSHGHITQEVQEHGTCYLQVPRIPTWSDLLRSLTGLGRSTSIIFFSPVWLP